MNAILLVLVLLLAGSTEGSTAAVEPPAPGHAGAIPSGAAQKALKGLRGVRFTDTDGALGGGEWVFDTFAVIPNPTTGHGPVAGVHRASFTPPSPRPASGIESPDYLNIPVASDGDAADLFRRVRGTAHPDLRGEMSEGYRRFLERLKK